MSAVIPFSGHKRLRCTALHDYGDWACAICGGGLYQCAVCGGAEGSLPTDCPGVPMSAAQEEAVYGGVLDYDRRHGWINRASSQWNPSQRRSYSPPPKRGEFALIHLPRQV